MMKARWVGIAAGVCAPLVLAAVAHAGGARKYTMIKVHTASGHVCAKTEVDALRGDGTAFGTASCGHAEAFVRAKTGEVSFYRLPAKDAPDTYATAIASDGTLAVQGYAGKNDYEGTSYLVSPDGTVTRVTPPAAHVVTYVTGVNKHGKAVGSAHASSSSFPKPFVYRHGIVRHFHAHKYLPDGAHGVRLRAISDSGRIAGSFYKRDKAKHDNAYAFVLSHGHRRIIDLPAALRTSYHHVIGGSVIDEVTTNGMVGGEMFGRHGRDRGFVVIHGTLHVIDPRPGVKHPGSAVLALNGHGEVGGYARVGGHRNYTGFLGHVG